MSDRPRGTRSLLRLTPLLGIGLLGYLLTTVKLNAVVTNAKAIGWGMFLVIALGGFSHIVKTWAWRLTLRGEAHKVSFGRSLALRLISEAIGQFGFVGMVGGEAARVSLLGSGVSMPVAISSVALDRSLFILAGAVVTIAGIVGLVFAVSLTHAVHIYAAALVFGLVCLLFAGAIAIRRRWPVFSGPARAAARIPWFRTWLQSKEPTLKASEQRIVEFCHEAPAAFWSSVFLNLLCHFLAIVEVFLIIKMLGAPATLLGALILESLTKLINVIGAVNPGNVGTYEGGNMMIGRLVRMTGTQGLLLALCRRVRALVWAVIGGICLVWLSKKKMPAGVELNREIDTSTTTMPSEDSLRSFLECETTFILAHDLPHHEHFESSLARVATLPVLLRTILGVQSKGRVRTIVVVNPDNGPRIRRELLATGRLPASTEWLAVPVGTTLSHILRIEGPAGGRIAFVMGNCTYRPALLRLLHEWKGEAGAIEVASSGKPVGLVVLTQEMAAHLATESESTVLNVTDLHVWIAGQPGYLHPSNPPCLEVDEDSWQAITCPQDCAGAERKLDRWLVKSTDGVFARMNRRVSIPISRQLIKFPITPNMVSLFTLGVSVASGVYFALGGYWNSLVGALLSVCGSILDGCDGEVARLKLQVSEFGCWLDSICDYLYYIVTFVGITIGLVRSKGDPSVIGWVVALFAGALLTFIMAGIGRKRLAGNRPEQYLELWQKKAEQRSAGLLLKMGRYTEFIVRRCFLPYLVLVMALLNLTGLVVYMGAFGANVAWIVSLRSIIAFSPRYSAKMKTAAATGPQKRPLAMES